MFNIEPHSGADVHAYTIVRTITIYHFDIKQYSCDLPCPAVVEGGR
jgi:hypothetical protein